MGARIDHILGHRSSARRKTVFGVVYVLLALTQVWVALGESDRQTLHFVIAGGWLAVAGMLLYQAMAQRRTDRAQASTDVKQARTGPTRDQ